mgnify:CR=1 FL=1
MSGSERTQLRWIVQGGATPRILDLWSVKRRYGNTVAHESQPFFRSVRLNSSFIIKHTVRPQERSYIASDRPVVTKLIVPVSHEDLSLGGHTFFVEESRFDARLKEFLGVGPNNNVYRHDLARIRALARLPSFDPFLLADRFAQDENPVARLYFNITRSDQKAMRGFVAAQIAEIVSLAFGEAGSGQVDERAMRFAEHLLDGDSEGQLDALRATLGLSAQEFTAGVFGWKGILYYSWRIEEVKADLRRFIIELNDLVIRGATASEASEINQCRRLILDQTRDRWKTLTGILTEYRTEFARFCSGEDPAAIRRFLLKAPEYFGNLGSDLAAVTHITSFWDYSWRGREKETSLPARDAMELLPGFLKSLQRDDRDPDEPTDADLAAGT